jgi:hypothetical protein
MWIRGPLDWVAVASLKSALAQGHVVHLYSYGDIPNLPRGITHLDARDIVPEDEIFHYDGVNNEEAFGSVAPFSDAFRYRMLASRPKIWIDADIYFVKRLDTARDVLLAWEGPQASPWDKDSFRYRLGNGVLRFPHGSPVLQDLVRITSRPYQMPPWVPPHIREAALKKLAGRPFFPGALTYASVGPVAVDYFVRKHHRLGDARSHEYYYPVSFRHMERFAEPDDSFRAALPAVTEVIHLWNSGFKRRFHDQPPAGSFAARLREEALDA